MYPLGNSHGGIVEVAGQWYVFDHRVTNATLFSRQGVAEPIEIADDGSISMVHATSCGLNGGSLRGEGSYPAYIACQLYGGACFDPSDQFASPYVTQDEEDHDPDKGGAEPIPYVCNIKDSATLGYKHFSLEGNAGIRLAVRGTAQGVLCAGVEPGEGEEVPLEIDMQTWTWVYVPFAASGDEVPLYMRYRGEGSFALREFEFVKA